MKKLLALTFTLLMAGLAAQADVIYQDVFNYSNGPIANVSTNVVGGVLVTNWFTHSGANDSFVNNHQLEVSSTTAYLGVTTTRGGDVHRNFATTANSPYTNVQQVLYASFVVTFTNLPLTNGAGSYFAHFYYNSTTFGGKLWATQVNPGATAPANVAGLPGTFRLGVSQGGSSTTFVNTLYPVDLALNTPYQVVMGFNPTTSPSSDGNLPYPDSITLWINPISSSDPNIVSSDTFTVPTAPANAFAFRQAGNFGAFVDVSNLVLSTSFPEAATNVLATNAVPPTIVTAPVGGTNFVGDSFTFTAVANGQGLSGLTYTWFKDGALYSNPNGNSNVLPIFNTTIPDTGSYQLAVTTPYGLSVTSAPAFLWVTNAPVPPTIVTQPSSNTLVYAHSSAILHVVASGPPSFSYQWFQNNTPISDSAVFSGTASDTLTITDITTDNGNTGTYRVEVTNPYGTTPSSNAVVSVTVPAAVSIAYLRSLVDPLTYAATNVPPTIAYQVTGIVTTFTNITTGNTSSYYLQDGTAGINIFATFATSDGLFRPAQGDMVTFVGVLSSFTGLELYADPVGRTYTSFTVNSSGNPLPAPIAIPFNVTDDLSNVNYNVAGSLVKLSNVYFGTNAGVNISTNAYTATVTNALGQSFKLSFFAVDQDTWNQTLPAFASSVTGVLYGGNPNFSVAVTKFSDINTNAVIPSPIPLAISHSGANVVFTWSDPSFSLQSSASVTGPYTTIPGATSGFSTNTQAATMFFRLSYP